MLRAALAAAALAFVMPTWSVLKRVANGRDELSTTAVRAEGLLLVAPIDAKAVAAALGTPWESGELKLSATVMMRLPGRCRLDLSSPDTSKTLTFAWANGQRRAEGSTWPAAQALVEELCATLALHSAADGESRQALDRHLQSLKVDLKLTSLARVGNQVAVVVGDRAELAPSFWVYKDKFLPARVRFQDAQGRWDVRFQDYESQAVGDALPRVAEVAQDGEPRLRLMLLTGDVKAGLDGVKF